MWQPVSCRRSAAVLRSGTPYVLRLCNNGAAGIFISPNKNGCRYSAEARGNPCAYPEMSPSVLLTAVRNCFPCAPSAKNNIVNSETSEMKPASEVLWVWETLCMNPPSFCCSPKFVIFTGRNGRVCVPELCLSVQQSSISCHPVCCSVFQIEENVLHIDYGTDFVSHANVIVYLLLYWLSCADYSHSICLEFGSIMNHRKFSHCIFTRPNFYLV